MLSERPFNDEDIAQINNERIDTIWPEEIFFFVVPPVILAFIFIGFGMGGYMIALVILLLYFAGPTLFELALNKYRYMLELDNKIKYCGEIKILKKNHLGKKYVLHTDSSLQKKIHLNNETVFDRIEIGDMLYIEI